MHKKWIQTIVYIFASYKMNLSNIYLYNDDMVITLKSKSEIEKLKA